MALGRQALQYAHSLMSNFRADAITRQNRDI
jgi:hypothetical protein